MCRTCGYVGTKASMTKHQATCVGRQPQAGTAQQHGPVREVFRLRVSGGGPFWLDLEVPVNATLDDIDDFLRGIWLDCCGHLSEFTVGPQSDWDDFDPFKPPRRKKQPPLSRLLSVGQKFGYTYDMGSSTNLELTVQARESVVAGMAPHAVTLLARNLPPGWTCSKCGAPARWIHSWEYDEQSGLPVFYCGRHGKSTRDEQLPVVNSPRMGVCGYEGGNMDEWPPADGQGTAKE